MAHVLGVKKENFAYILPCLYSDIFEKCEVITHFINFWLSLPSSKFKRSPIIKVRLLLGELRPSLVYVIGLEELHDK